MKKKEREMGKDKRRMPHGLHHHHHVHILAWRGCMYVCMSRTWVGRKHNKLNVYYLGDCVFRKKGRKRERSRKKEIWRSLCSFFYILFAMNDWDLSYGWDFFLTFYFYLFWTFRFYPWLYGGLDETRRDEMEKNETGKVEKWVELLCLSIYRSVRRSILFQ